MPTSIHPFINPHMSKKAPEPPEEVLLKSVFNKVPGAWQNFFERYHRLMVSCVKKVYIRYGVSFNSEDIEDLVGSICYNLVKDDFHKLKMFDPERGYRLSSWVGLIATNTAHDTLRRRAPDHMSLDDEGMGLHQLPGPLKDPLENLETRERISILMEAIEQLSEVDQQFVQYYYGLNMAPEEVAQKMGITINTVYSRKNKVRSKLVKVVKRLLLRPKPHP